MNTNATDTIADREEDFTYTTNDGKVYITGLSNDTFTKLNIPSTISGLPVTKIGENAFANNTLITSVTFPDGLKEIGDDAFSGCSGITELEVPDTVIRIGTAAFKETKLVSISLPYVGCKENLDSSNKEFSVFGAIFGYTTKTSYYENVINNTTELTGQYLVDRGSGYSPSSSRYCGYRYYIPKTLRAINITNATQIPDNAFYNCEYIQTITLNEGITKIGTNSFYNCALLNIIELPQSVDSVGSKAFMKCSKLKSVVLPNSLIEIKDYTFSECTYLTNIQIPDKVNIIGEYAFNGCRLMETINIPQGVATIAKGTFNGCEWLNSITLPKSLNTIGDKAFYDCKRLKTIEINGVIDKIGSEAFYNCSVLEALFLDKTSIVGTKAFANCRKLKVYASKNTAAFIEAQTYSCKTVSTKSIELGTTTMTLFRDEKKTISCEVMMLNDKKDTSPYINWSSSNENVATVNNGVVTVVAPGESKIVAEIDGITAECTITVYFRLESIAFEKDKIEINVKTEKQLEIIYEPVNTTDNKTIEWKSDDPTIVSVTSDGKITGNKRGKTTVRAISKLGIETSIDVNVLVPSNEVRFDSSELKIEKGSIKKIEFAIFPENTTDTYTIKSENESIATVDDNGNIIGVSKGQTNVIVETSSGIIETCSIIVIISATDIISGDELITLDAGSSKQIEIEVRPTDTTDVVVWSSTNEMVAIVDQYGKVTAVNQGECNIIVQTSDMVRKNIKVNVLPVYHVQEIVINEKEMVIDKSTEKTITYSVIPENSVDTISIMSSDESIAKIKDNKIVAIKEGECVIYVVSSNNIQHSIKVKVIKQLKDASYLNASNIKANGAEFYCVPDSDINIVSCYFELNGKIQDVPVAKKKGDAHFISYKAIGGEVGKFVAIDNIGRRVEKEFKVPEKDNYYKIKIEHAAPRLIIANAYYYLSNSYQKWSTIPATAECYAIVGGVRYDMVDNITYEYCIPIPNANVGDKVKVVVINNDGYEYTDETIISPNTNNYSVTLNAITNSSFISGGFDGTPAVGIEKAYVKVNDGVYYADMSGGLSQYRNSFTISFPMVRDSHGVVCVEGTDGYVYEKDFVVPNIKPELDIDKIDSQTSKITGQTEGNSSIEILIGKKKYQTKSDKDGNFSKTIKKQKPGAKIKISVTTPLNHTNVATTTVKKVSSEIESTHWVLRDSKAMKFEVTKAVKGDRIKVKIGKKSFTKKINKTKKTLKVTVPIKGIKVGQVIKVTLVDKYGNKKASTKDKVYFANDVWVGMTEKQLLQTTFGEPDYRNDWGTGDIQWVYEYKGFTLYVYVAGGKVINYQKIHY